MTDYPQASTCHCDRMAVLARPCIKAWSAELAERVAESDSKAKEADRLQVVRDLDADDL